MRVLQGHDGASIAHQYHEQFGVDILRQRSLLNMLRSLLTDEGDELQTVMAPFDEKLKRLQRRQPRHILPRNCTQAGQTQLWEQRKR